MEINFKQKKYGNIWSILLKELILGTKLDKQNFSSGNRKVCACAQINFARVKIHGTICGQVNISWNSDGYLSRYARCMKRAHAHQNCSLISRTYKRRGNLKFREKHFLAHTNANKCFCLLTSIGWKASNISEKDNSMKLKGFWLF